MLPNAIERVLPPELLESNIPVVKLKPLRFSVPLTNVTVLAVAAVPYALSNVTVPAALSIVTTPTLLPLPLIVCVVPVKFTVRLVYVPPLANTKLVGVTPADDTLVLVLPVKSNILKIDPVVNDGTAVPELIYRFGALAAVPPALLPNLNVLVTVIGEENPPVPVHVNPLAYDISRTILVAAE